MRAPAHPGPTHALTYSHTRTPHILPCTHVLTPMPTHEAHECTQIHVCSHIHTHALIPTHADHACHHAGRPTHAPMRADPHMPACMPPNTFVSTHSSTYIPPQCMHRHTQAPSARMYTCPQTHAQAQAGSWVSPFIWVKGEA